MAKGSRATTRTAVTLDIKGLAAELGLPVQQGTVSAVGDRFYLTTGKTKRPIPVGETNSAADLRKLTGQPVSVILSGRNVVAIGFPKKPWVVCYLPVPDLIKEIGADVRQDLIKRFVDNKIIPANLGRRFTQALE